MVLDMSKIIPTGEMNERNLVKIASVLRPNNIWEAQQRFYYDKTNKRRYYQVDCVSYDAKIVIEYEGPDHYTDVWKSLRDDARKQFFLAEGFSFLRWPYYCQLTLAVSKYFFGSISKTAYLEAIYEVYGVKSEDSILACGFHTTTNTPSNFTYLGVQRFLDEVSYLPEVVGDQVAESLRRYCRDVGNVALVLGTDERLLLLLDRDPKSANIGAYYSRTT